MLGRLNPPAAPLPDWIPETWTLLLPGTALWALAFYGALTAPLSRLEEALAAGNLSEQSQEAVLVIASLLLALVVGGVTNLALGWALGPGWGTSLGVMAALYGLFWSLASRRGESGGGSGRQ